MRLLQTKYHGFTLIELIITVAISALVVGGGIAGFVGFTERQEVLNTAKEVQQKMRTAQSKARVRDLPNQNCVLASYEVSFGATNNQAILRPICSPTAVAALPAYSFPSGVTIQSKIGAGLYTTPKVIRFTTLENGVTDNAVTPALLTDSVTYKVSEGAIGYIFTVSPNGSISNVTKAP